MIAFEYRPTVSLREGIDAIADWQRIKLQKAMTKLELGSRFGDKSAIAAGFEDLGLTEASKRYQQPDMYGKEVATQAALNEYFSNKLKATEDKLVAEAYKKDLIKEEIGSSIAGSDNAKNFNFSKLSEKALRNPENIEKLIYSANSQTEAKTRMSKLLEEMIKRKGGLDVSDVAVFQQIDEGLARLYGQDYKPMDFSKYLKIQGRGGGSGSGVGGKDYVVIDEEGRVVASTAAANQADAIKQYAKKGGYAAIQGTFEDVVNMTKGFVDNAVSKSYGLEMAGIKIDKGFLGLGRPKFVDTKTGEEITLEEVYRRVLKSMVGAHKRPEEQNVQVQGKTVSYQQPTIPKGNKLDKEQSLEIFKKSQKPKNR